jgi:hypothetical protein
MDKGKSRRCKNYTFYLIDYPLVQSGLSPIESRNRRSNHAAFLKRPYLLGRLSQNPRIARALEGFTPKTTRQICRKPYLKPGRDIG